MVISVFFDTDGIAHVTRSENGLRLRTVAWRGKNLRQIAESMGVKSSWRAVNKHLWRYEGTIGSIPVWLR